MIPATRILCPIDFSPPSLRALRTAIGLSVLNQAPLHAFTVIEDLYHYADAAVPTDEEIGRTREALRGAVTAELPAGGHWLPQVEVSVWVGAAHEGILRAAVEIGADLIVIGTHGRSGVGKWLFGSTTERVLRTPPCPVLAVGRGDRDLVLLQPDAPVTSLHHVLAATDFGDDSGRALQVAQDVARAAGAELIVAHVMPRLSAMLTPSDATVAVQYEMEALAEIEQKLARMIASMTDVRASSRLLRGAPHVELLALAEQQAVDLIVMGAVGRGNLHHNLTGLTTYRVLSHAPCAVLVLPSAHQVQSAQLLSREYALGL
ncbi:MAG TPA: universal stress protein [Vicinamibacterales bacterium]|nr:universal stress protein [Vicinamibacterales bacterium]